MARKPAGFSDKNFSVQLGMLDMADSPAPMSSIGAEGHRDRMRTRILAGQGDSMAEYELLEMVLFIALPRVDTKTLSKTLIARFGSFSNAIAAPPEELREVKGVGDSAIATMKVIKLAAQRLARAEVLDRPVLNNWDRLMDYLHAMLARERVEQFRVLFLDTRNRLLADEAQARGTVNHTPVYPREVIKRALELKATALILVHNHPSGDPTPSRDDIEMTQEVKRAASALSIALHDHVIVGNGKWFSFKQEGLL